MFVSEIGNQNLGNYDQNFKITKKLNDGYVDSYKNKKYIYKGCGAVLAYLMSGEATGTKRISIDKLAEELYVSSKRISNWRNKENFKIYEILKVAVFFRLEYPVSIAMIQYSDIKWFYKEKGFDKDYDRILRLAYDENNFIYSTSEILKKLKK